MSEAPGLIRITRETDYAILLLAQMGRAPGLPRSAREAAGETGVSLPMAGKILKALTRGGLLHSNRGAKGGYQLERPIERITIADVIRVIEGPIGLVDCVAHPGECEHEPSCPTSLNWKRINQAIQEALESVAVSELADCSSRPLLQLGTRAAGA